MAGLEAGGGQQRRLVELPENLAGKLLEERVPTVRLALSAFLPCDVVHFEQDQAGQKDLLFPKDALDPPCAFLILDERQQGRGIKDVALTFHAHDPRGGSEASGPGALLLGPRPSMPSAGPSEPGRSG